MLAKIKQININYIKQVIQESKSLAEVCRKLECIDNGSNRNYLKEIIKDYSLNTNIIKSKTSIEENNIRLCKNCGKIISSNKKDIIFCSKSCSAIYNNSKRTKLEHISDNEFTIIINNSKGWKEILKNLGYSENTKSNIRKKIQDRCNSLGIILNNKDNLQDKTKKQLFEERANWQSARSAIVKLASKIYHESGKDYKCAVCGYDKHVEIAHIKAVSDFPETSTVAEINDINNLIGLCPNHHWEYDNGLLDLKEYIK